MKMVDETCDFHAEYVPIEEATDEPLMTHLQNCSVCQDEIRIVDEA